MPTKEEDKKLKTATSQSRLERLVMPGAKVKLFFGDGNINNATLHIRAIIDEDQVVFKRWLKHKQYWLYEVKDMYFFQLRLDQLTKT